VLEVSSISTMESYVSIPASRATIGSGRPGTGSPRPYELNRNGAPQHALIGRHHLVPAERFGSTDCQILVPCLLTVYRRYAKRSNIAVRDEAVAPAALPERPWRVGMPTTIAGQTSMDAVGARIVYSIPLSRRVDSLCAFACTKGAGLLRSATSTETKMKCFTPAACTPSMRLRLPCRSTLCGLSVPPRMADLAVVITISTPPLRSWTSGLRRSEKLEGSATPLGHLGADAVPYKLHGRPPASGRRPPPNHAQRCKRALGQPRDSRRGRERLPSRGEPAENLSLSLPGSAAAIWGDGKRCQAQAIRSSQYCINHDPTQAGVRQRRNSKGGKTGGRGRPGGPAEVADLKARLKDLAEQVLQGEVDKGRAAVVIQIFNSYLRAVEVNHILHPLVSRPITARIRVRWGVLINTLGEDTVKTLHPLPRVMY
jgi:hypothetical protein